MKSSKLLLFFGIFMAVVSVFILIVTNRDSMKEYVAKTKERQQIIVTQRMNEKGLFKNKADAKRMTFFDVSEKFRVKAEVERLAHGQFLFLKQTHGEMTKYIRHSKLKFTLGGKKHELILLQNADDPSDFFLPFRDKSNGKETYGGGRYLSLTYSEKKMVLDFNLTYNPYCVYNKKFTCPIPPPENNLAVEILAGEKNYK